MGANVTKSATDIVNEAIISTALKAAQDCSQYVDSTQSITSGGVGLFGSYTQSANFSLTCLQNINIDSNLITQMTNKIMEDVKQTNTPLLPTVNIGDTQTNIKNILKSKITNEFFQSCAASLKNYQTQTYGGIQIGTKGKQDINVVVKCMSDALNKNGVAQSIVTSNTVTNVQTSKSPLSFITDIVKGFTWFIYLIIILIVGGIVWGLSSG